MIDQLHSLGLTDGESKVFLALSEIGSTTVGPIVKKSGVAYSNIYDILNRLINKGIVTYIIKNKTKYFQAVSPRNIIKYLEKKELEIQGQKKILNNILPQLEQIQNLSPKQSAQLFIGRKGLRSAYDLLVRPKQEVIFFYIHHKAYAKEADLFYLNIRDILTSASLYRGIANRFSEESKVFKDQEIMKNFQMRYVDFPIPGNIEICQNRIIFVSWEKPITTVLIESFDIANNFRTYFNSVWSTGQ